MNYLSKHGCSRHCAKLLFIEATVTLVASSLSPVRFGQGYRERLTLLSLFSALKATETCVCPRPIIPCVRVGQVRCSQRFQNTDITLAFKWRAEPRKKRQVSWDKTKVCEGANGCRVDKDKRGEIERKITDRGLVRKGRRKKNIISRGDDWLKTKEISCGRLRPESRARTANAKKQIFTTGQPRALNSMVSTGREHPSALVGTLFLCICMYK